MFKFVRSGRSLLQGGATSSEEPLLWRSLLKGGASSWEEPLVSILVSILYHFGNLGLHFSSFWKPWFTFWMILEPWFPFQVILETLVSIKGIPLPPKEGVQRGCGGGAEGVWRGCGGGATSYSCTNMHFAQPWLLKMHICAIMVALNANLRNHKRF